MESQHQSTTASPFVDGYYLTDGGLETTLIFHHGFELPHFASFPLVQDPKGRDALRNYFGDYLSVARKHGLNFLLETPTWRANKDWGGRLGYSEPELDQVNRDSVKFIQSVKAAGPSETPHFVVSGQIGPRGDGYVPGDTMTLSEAKAFHMPQIRSLAEAGVDFVSAFTINYVEEATGIVQAAREVGVPVVISLTVETDGKLVGGDSMEAAITGIDRQTDGYAMHYMINCAHPEHFGSVLKAAGDWRQRIHGIRANASTKSHAELDESETLDVGDRTQLANGYRELMKALPNLKVIGGCCGTDHSHMEVICEALFMED